METIVHILHKPLKPREAFREFPAYFPFLLAYVSMLGIIGSVRKSNFIERIQPYHFILIPPKPCFCQDTFNHFRKQDDCWPLIDPEAVFLHKCKPSSKLIFLF
ncbi:Uncharacterised protein [Mycobacteroides abscessus subsp. abscessus]|nr:Uncharacterised protein [Mycobacteroides abscessus subsp. abscessus]